MPAGAFAQAGGFTVINHDSVQFPPRLSVLEGGAARRIEALNDARLSTHAFGRHEEVTITGARGDAVQMWLIYPPGFDAKKKHPVMHVIHGGPLTGASLNPARTIGPAIAAGIFSDIWLYIVGPVVGGLLAGLLYNARFKDVT